ncbi:MAG TPA: tripartite tricarboxylate transporter substrate binding protein [Burkholderiales bacterium]|nr:tripartite tricarboxylate transporter substrate binding protein [Burkholderiales bacterium]
MFAKFVLLLATLLCALAHAQTYPSKPVRFVVPFAPGGSGDVVGRTIGAKLTEAWGQQILIDNRPGAAGTIGAAIVARSPADGYTLLLADDSPLAITPHIQNSLPFDPQKDFAPIVPIAQIEFLLTVHPSVPAANLAELVALLKANPGKYSYASAGIGSIHHLSMEWLKQAAGVDMVHVPYKGSGQILPDVIAGQVAITYTGLAQTMPFVQGGKLKAIAIGGPRRVGSAPGVPPVAETYAGFNGTTSWNLLAPAGTPPDILQKLNIEVNRILRDPQTVQQLESRGLFPLGGSAEQFAVRMKADFEKWGKIIADVGLKAE